MLRNKGERKAVSAILRANGFSQAWVLTDTDKTEDVFLVPADELEALGHLNPTLEIMKVLTGRKVWIAPFRPVAPVKPLF